MCLPVQKRCNAALSSAAETFEKIQSVGSIREDRAVEVQSLLTRAGKPIRVSEYAVLLRKGLARRATCEEAYGTKKAAGGEAENERLDKKIVI